MCASFFTGTMKPDNNVVRIFCNDYNTWYTGAATYPPPESSVILDQAIQVSTFPMCIGEYFNVYLIVIFSPSVWNLIVHIEILIPHGVLNIQFSMFIDCHLFPFCVKFNRAYGNSNTTWGVECTVWYGNVIYDTTFAVFTLTKNRTVKF